MAVKKKARSSAASRREKPATGQRAAARSGARAAAAAPRAPRGSATKAVAKPALEKVAKKAVEKAAAASAAGATRRRAAAGGSSSSTGGGVGEGDAAPDFQLRDQAGEELSAAELAGHPYVLYFYPKDDTPGCTTEACGFRDALPAFERLGVRVLGVSPDSSASHERFRSKYSLPFTLLSDDEKELATAYGVWALKKNYGREYMGVVRSTFLVDAGGVVRKVWRNVKVNGHVEQVQAAAAELG